MTWARPCIGSFMEILDTEAVVAKEYADNHKLAGTDNYNYVVQRIHNRLWKYVKGLGVMPARIQQTHKDLYGLYMQSRECNCSGKRTLPKPKPCRCETTILFQQGCMCGGC